MSLYEEVQLLRKELRLLRQESARFRLAWQQQKARADHAEEKNYELMLQCKLLGKENAELKAKFASTASRKNKLPGMIFKTDVKKEKDEQSRPRGGQAGHALTWAGETSTGRSRKNRVHEQLS